MTGSCTGLPNSTVLLANWTGDDPDCGYILRPAIVTAVLAAAPFAL